MPEFSGSDYDPHHDKARLTGQIGRVHNFMKDGEWHTLSEIERGTHDPAASISAQLRNLRKEQFGGHEIRKRARGDRSRGLFEYCMVVEGQMTLL